MKIVVLAGGLSTERQVSLTSGTGVCRALRQRGHQAILVDMFLGLESYTGRLADVFDAPDGLCGDNRVHSTEPDLEAVRRSRRDQGPSMLGKDVLAVCARADLVFLALHGACGEDGRIQATLDLLGVPYTGSGYLGSGMAMDKSVTKRIMDAAGVPTAPWHDVRYTREDIPRLARELPVPCAVKIINGGSSIGVELPDPGGAGPDPGADAGLRKPRHRGEEDQGSGDPGGRSGRHLPPRRGDHPQGRVFRLFLQIPEGRGPGALPRPYYR